ncbi:MAG: hypothetical protein ACYDEY_15730 [Acidimicrobiales bacterium]
MAARYHEWPAGLAERVWENVEPCLTPLDLLRIAAWKSGRGLGNISLNEAGFIERRTKETIAELSRWRECNMVGCDDETIWRDWLDTAWRAVGDKSRGTGLLGIRGVGYPVATAILCVLTPTVWPVIDRWAVKTVFGPLDCDTLLAPHLWQKGIVYQHYARRLATEGARVWGTDLTLHELDVKAMAASQIRNGQRLGVIPMGWTAIALPDNG